MIKTKYMFSEAKDTTSKAKDLAPKAKDMTSCPLDVISELGLISCNI